MALNLAKKSKEVGREIFYMVELDLEMCGNVYAESPCTAGLLIDITVNSDFLDGLTGWTPHEGTSGATVTVQDGELTLQQGTSPEWISARQVIDVSGLDFVKVSFDRVRVITGGTIRCGLHTVDEHTTTPNLGFVQLDLTETGEGEIEIDVSAHSLVTIIIADASGANAASIMDYVKAEKREGVPGTECYNTWSTCVDRENFTSIKKTLRFTPSTSALPIGLEAYPCITRHPSITPAKVEIMQGIGSRGAISVQLGDFTQADHLDPYWRTRLEPATGTWLGRFMARFPWVKGRPLRLYTGYANEPFNPADLSERLYFIDVISGLDRKGNIQIKGKDILDGLSSDKKNAPEVSQAWLTEDLSTSETTIDYDFDPEYPLLPGPAYIEIGEEVIHYTTNTGEQLQQCTRGAWGTDEKDIHEIDDAIQQALFYENVNIIDVIYDLLVNFGEVDPQYIPYADWETERDLWLLDYNINAILTKPTGIDRSISELCHQYAINVWWDETRQEIRLKSVSPEPLNAEIPSLDDFANFLENSVEVIADDKNQITQLWIYYGVQDPTNSLTDPGNFKKLTIAKDLNVENENALGEPKIRKIYGNWIAETQGNLIPLLIERILKQTSKNIKKIKFSLDAKDISFWLGDNVVVKSDRAQDAAGRVLQLRATIIKVTERIPATRYDFEAIGSEFQEAERYGFITYNDFPHYSDATDDQKRTGAFASDGENPFPDGGEPYKII